MATNFPRALVGAAAIGALAPLAHPDAAARAARDSFLDANLLVTWCGNPDSRHMGVLGERTGAARADALRRQAGAFAGVTAKQVVPAYHLVRGADARLPPRARHSAGPRPGRR